MAGLKENRPVASHEIARARGIPERFLLKILKPLVSKRVLLSMKGPNGGYRLAKSPTQIALLEIVEAVDGPIRGQVPANEGPGDEKLTRKLQTICDQAADALRRQLQSVSVAELATKTAKATKTGKRK
jgi:Rrf2 family protein